ncbi:hypothetical protein BH18ACI5_BH18ACI5_15230 [soil metagenome]
MIREAIVMGLLVVMAAVPAFAQKKPSAIIYDVTIEDPWVRVNVCIEFRPRFRTGMFCSHNASLTSPLPTHHRRLPTILTELVRLSS